MRQQSCWGILGFFKRPWVSLLKRQRNRQHDICILITNTRTNRVAIVSSVITKNVGRSRLNFFFTSSVNQCLFIFVASFPSFFVCCLIFIRFSSAFVEFVLFDYLVFDYLLIQCICLFWYWYFDPYFISTNNHSVVNKHHTSDSAIFCLSIGIKSLLPS